MLALNTAFDTLKHLVTPTTRDIRFLPVHGKFCTHLPKEALVLCCAGDSSAPELTAIAFGFHSFWPSIILTVTVTLMILTTSLIQINTTLLHLSPFYCLKHRGFVSLEEEHSQIQLQCSISSFNSSFLFTIIYSYHHHVLIFLIPIPLKHFYRSLIISGLHSMLISSMYVM